jgi:hypothetical protein
MICKCKIYVQWMLYFPFNVCGRNQTLIVRVQADSKLICIAFMKEPINPLTLKVLFTLFFRILSPTFLLVTNHSKKGIMEGHHHIVKNNFLMPALKLDDQKFEFIFLLDNSGSMNGMPIELAKKALNVRQKFSKSLSIYELFRNT